jgi:branched-chain amino acid aminotransferase
MPGTHEYIHDPRNDDVLIYLDGELVPRAEAKVSVFDSGFVLGDGVWEGLRLHNGKYAFLDKHLDRLFEGAATMQIDIGMSRAALVEALYRTVRENGMETGVHVRLMITRGLKHTPSQDPRVNVGPPTIVIAAEYKEASPEPRRQGIELITSHIRRGRADVQDPKINSHSKLNCILAMLGAINVGADEALMLDPHGFVATCNATNFFVVRGGEVWTSTGDYCLNGVTREVVLEICRDNGITACETNFSLPEVYSADEAFVTGTFGGPTPVVAVDRRTIGGGTPGTLTRRLTELYEQRVARETGPSTDSV